MEYRIVRNDELYHHGVRGMKWGVRRQASVSSGRSQNPSIRTPISSEQRKTKVKKAAKIGVAVAGAALAAYGGYKVYKLQGDAVISLGKKYARMGDTHMSIARNRLDSSASTGIDARRLAYQASIAKRSDDRKVFSEGARNLRAISEERRSAAQESINTAKQYYNKAANKNYSRKEVVREMSDIVKRRKRNGW